MVATGRERRNVIGTPTALEKSSRLLIIDPPSLSPPLINQVRPKVRYQSSSGMPGQVAP